MESAVIALLAEYDVNASGRIEAPGVYIGEAKIASVGLKIKKNFCYHGVALNVDMDLEPFTYINPCGYPGLRVTQTKDLGITDNLDIIALKLAQQMQKKLLHRNIESL